MHHMCEENRVSLDAVDSKHDAIELYKKTIDWALEEGYPSMSALREDFADCGSEGVFVDKEFHGDTLIDQQVYVFHHCTGAIRVGLNVEKQIIPMLYFANGCDMRICGVNGAGMQIRVPVYIFGQNRVSAEQSEDLECVIYKTQVK